MTTQPAIRIDDLTVRYGTLVAANRISLEVPEGEVFGLVGPNGAGKTTTLKVLAGLLLPDSGRATVAGWDVCASRNEVHARIGYMADFFGVYDYLTVHEYLSFFGGMYGLDRAALEQRISLLLDTVNLAPKRSAFVRTLSRGMKQRLYLGRALIHDPPVLILDEPASGLDPRGRKEMIDTLQRLHREGKTVVISSHILEELQLLCTSVGIMEAGRLVGTGSLRAAATVARRQVLLPLPAGEAERAVAVLEAHPAVHSARVTAHGVLLEVPDDDAAVSEIVRHLVSAGIRVLLPRLDSADLRDIFLRMTKGELM